MHRIITTWDAAGWRPSQGDIDRYGREIPDEEYHTSDFERIIALKARTDAVAHHLLCRPGLPGGNTCYRMLKRTGILNASFPLNLFDLMTVYAVKS